MSSIEKHLGKSEKIILTLNSPRKAFLGDYISMIVLILIAVVSRTNVKLTFIMYMLITLAVILFIKIEGSVRSKKYFLTNERIIKSDGMFRKKFTSCAYNKITGVEFTQSKFEKSTNTGTVKIVTADSGHKMFLEKIADPAELKKRIGAIYSSAPQGMFQNQAHAMQNNFGQMQQPFVQPSHIHIHIHTDAPQPHQEHQYAATNYQQPQSPGPSHNGQSQIHHNPVQQHHAAPNHQVPRRGFFFGSRRL